jgi:hypothetical protein
MCDPLTIAGAALAGGGTLLQMNAQNDANNAANDATEAERIRQQNLERQSNALFSANLSKGYGNLPADVAKAQGARTAAYNSILPPAADGSAYTPGATPAPSIIGNDAASRAASSAASTKNAVTAKAKLGSLGDLLFNTDIGTARAGQGISGIGQQQIRSQNILPLELEAAQLKARSPLGALMAGIGGGVMNAGAMGAGANLPNLFTTPGSPTLQGLATRMGGTAASVSNPGILPWSLG